MSAISAPARRRIFSLCVLLLSAMLFAVGERAYAATCVVTNTNGSGAGSLNDCLYLSSSDTIDLTGVTGVIVGNFAIYRNVVLTGPPSGGLSIQGAPSAGQSVFDTSGNLSITVANLTVTGGSGTGGGGIFTGKNTSLTLINTVVTGNAVSDRSVSGGGGIFAEGPVTMIASRVTGNSATAQNSYAGGVEMDNATLTLACGSTVTGNTASRNPDIDGSSTTSSTVFCVTSLADDGATGVGELNDVLGQANAVANSSVYFVGISGTISLNHNLPGIAQTLNVIGPGAKFLTINGKNNGGKPVFQIFANRTVGISGLTITGAVSQQDGGGIYSQGNLTLDKSVVAGNTNNSTSGGGGIYEGSSGTLTVMNSAIVANTCLTFTGAGGGIRADGPLVLVNSTVAGNTAPQGGGGIRAQVSASLVNSTVTGNTSNGRDGLETDSFSIPPTLVNTIVEGNSGGTAYSDLYSNDGYTDGGGNLVNASTTATSDPKLLAVTNSSGTLLHYIPLPGSPAICAGVATATAGNAPAVPTTDQRGAGRPYAYGSTTCYDSGSIQSAYSSIAFTNSTNGYSGNANTAVSPAPTVAVIENGVNLGGVPIALSFSGSSPVTASGLTATTVAGTGATFSNLQVNTPGSYSISTGATASSTTATLSAKGVSPAATLPASAATVTITYPTPTITSVSPTYGPAAGGTVVTITGTNFTGATIVSFGNAQASSYTVNSATQITATSPSGTGTVDVIVTNPTTSSAPSTADNFTYISLSLSAPKTLTGQAGAAYSQSVTASGGTSPYTYSVPANTLPGGLTLSTTTGAITGTPTAVGTFAVTVTVKDSSNSTAQSSFKLSISAPTIVVVTTAAFPALTVGVTPSLAFKAIGGTATYAYTVANGAVPTGLTLNSDGTVSGAPTTAGSYSFSVRAADSTTGSGAPYSGTSQTYSGTVGKGSATVTFTVASLTPTYNAAALNASATVTPNSVPASELTYTYTGTGVTTYGPSTTPPTAVGTYSVTATLTDANYTGTQSSSFTISSATLTLIADSKSRAYGVANPTFTGTINNVQGSDNITESFSTAATITSDAGSYAIVPSASGANLSNYTVTTTNGSLTIIKANTTATVIPSTQVVAPNGTFSLTATVASVTSGTPSGLVSFFDNGVQIGSPVSLRGGVAQLSVQASTITPGIQHSFTATYAGDNLDFNGSASTAGTVSTITVLPNDFSLTLNSGQTITVIPSQSISYVFQIAPTYTLYPGPVSFTATGLPPGATVSFSPTSLAANAGPQTVTMTINTVLASNRMRSIAPVAFGLLILPLAMFRRKRMRSILLMAMGIGLIGGITGCGVPSGFFGQAPQNYTVTVTTTAGTTTHSSTFVLNVQ